MISCGSAVPSSPACAASAMKTSGAQASTSSATSDSSPVICAEKVVFGADDGRVYMVSLIDGKKIWSDATQDAITTSPAIANGMIVIGSDDGFVYAFGEK